MGCFVPNMDVWDMGCSYQVMYWGSEWFEGDVLGGIIGIVVIDVYGGL